MKDYIVPSAIRQLAIAAFAIAAACAFASFYLQFCSSMPAKPACDMYACEGRDLTCICENGACQVVCGAPR